MKKFVRILRRIVKWFFRLTIIIVSLGILSFVIVIIVVYRGFHGTATFPADCGLVFGAAVYGNSIAGPAVARRMTTAAELYRNGEIKKLIVSGGVGKGNRVSEAEVMRSVAMQLGVNPTDIIMEKESHSTWQNLSNSKPLAAECTSTVGVSDGYHLARIKLIAWRQHWDNFQTYPALIRPEAGSERRSVLREAILYLYFRFYIDRIYPINV